MRTDTVHPLAIYQQWETFFSSKPRDTISKLATQHLTSSLNLPERSIRCLIPHLPSRANTMRLRAIHQIFSQEASGKLGPENVYQGSLTFECQTSLKKLRAHEVSDSISKLSIRDRGQSRTDARPEENVPVLVQCAAECTFRCRDGDDIAIELGNGSGEFHQSVEYFTESVKFYGTPFGSWNTNRSNRRSASNLRTVTSPSPVIHSKIK